MDTNNETNNMPEIEARPHEAHTEHDEAESAGAQEAGTQKKSARLVFRSAASTDTLVFKRSHLYALLLPLAFVLGLSVGFLFWGRDSGAAPAAPPSQAQAETGGDEQAVKRYDVSVDDDPAIGPANAAITLIEFSDYECPYCRRWHEQVFFRLLEEYPDQVRIVYRDFPLTSIHPNALPAAQAANCAGEQESFWEFHNKLFSGEYELSEADYLLIAEDLALNLEDFQACLDSGRYEDEVMADYNYAANLGIRSTPTFFLNGLPIVGAQPYDVFKEVIDKELRGEIPK